jgi:excinuclease ABC subunit B
VIDESHATVPQIGGMFEGDRSRKTVLVEHGFRLPSALDNRPAEFSGIPVHAEPDDLRQRHARPAGNRVGAASAGAPSRPARLWIMVASGDAGVARRANSSCAPPAWLTRRSRSSRSRGQIDDLIEECRKRADAKERVLVTTLTKRTAEELTDYLRDIGVNVRYLHSEIDAIERVEILRALRKGEFDVLVGINLLREGLDLPEVSLVAILDADKEGFLRSETSLIQTAGRAARHLNGEVILYADVMTHSIKKFLAVTEYRRQKQIAYNREHHITPRSVSRAVEESLATYESKREEADAVLHDAGMDVDLSRNDQ